MYNKRLRMKRVSKVGVCMQNCVVITLQKLIHCGFEEL